MADAPWPGVSAEHLGDDHTGHEGNRRAADAAGRSVPEFWARRLPAFRQCERLHLPQDRSCPTGVPLGTHRVARYMRLRSHRQNLVVWGSSGGPAGGYGAPRPARTGRTRRIRRSIRTGALLAAIGLTRLAQSVRTRRGARHLVAGAVLAVVGIILPSGVIQICAMLVLLRGVAVALGVSERHRRPGGEPAGVDVAGFRTRP